MQQSLTQPLIYADFSSGLLDDLSVGKGLVPPNAVRKAVNVVFDRPRGGVSQRYGTTALGSTPGGANTIRGLHNFITSSGTNRLLAVSNGMVYYYDGAAWQTGLSGATTATLKTRFFTYLDTVVFMNGTDTQQSSTNGTAWVGGGGNLDVGNMPKGKFAAVLNGRMQIAGNSNNPDTLYESSIVSSGAVSWTSGNKTTQVNPNDGAGNLTGLTGNGRVSLLFKQRGLYRYDGNSLERVGFIGTPSHESVVTDDNGVTYFFGQGANGVGFYATDGGRPVKISRPITRYVEAISGSSYANVAAYTNGQLVEWAVGSVTVGDNTYANASLVYSISDKTWTVFSRADSFRVFSQFIDANSNITVVGGDTDGNVQTINSGTTDNGDPINSEVEFFPIVFTTRGRVKSVKGLVAYAEHFQGLTLLAKMDQGRFEEIGGVDSANKYFRSLQNFRGHELTMKVIATNTGTPFELTGFEFPPADVQDEDYQRTV